MIETIAIVMLILWLAGVITSNTLGGFIHILLVIAIVMFLVRIIRGWRRSFDSEFIWDPDWKLLTSSISPVIAQSDPQNTNPLVGIFISERLADEEGGGAVLPATYGAIQIMNWVYGAMRSALKLSP